MQHRGLAWRLPSMPPAKYTTPYDLQINTSDFRTMPAFVEIQGSTPATSKPSAPELVCAQSLLDYCATGPSRLESLALTLPKRSAVARDPN